MNKAKIVTLAVVGFGVAAVVGSVVAWKLWPKKQDDIVPPAPVPGYDAFNAVREPNSGPQWTTDCANKCSADDQCTGYTEDNTLHTCYLNRGQPGSSWETKYGYSMFVKRDPDAPEAKWSEWSACPATCGGVRYRTCSVEGKCPGESADSDSCPGCAWVEMMPNGTRPYPIRDKPTTTRAWDAEGRLGCLTECQDNAECRAVVTHNTDHTCDFYNGGGEITQVFQELETTRDPTKDLWIRYDRRGSSKYDPWPMPCSQNCGANPMIHRTCPITGACHGVDIMLCADGPCQ